MAHGAVNTWWISTLYIRMYSVYTQTRNRRRHDKICRFVRAASRLFVTPYRVLRSRLFLIALIISKSSYQGKYGNIVMDILVRAYHRRYQYGVRYRYLVVNCDERTRFRLAHTVCDDEIRLEQSGLKIMWEA